MSTEEQDQIHGRLLRERRESKPRLAAIAIKLNDTGADLRHAGTALLDLAKSGWAGSPDSVLRAIQKLPDTAALLALVDEAIEEQRKARDIEKQLAEFGPQ